MIGSEPIMAHHGQLSLSDLLVLVALFNPGQDPTLDLAEQPATAAIPQRNRLREGTRSNVFVDGRAA
ncbi:hypothetical protein D9M70_612670 [compost metagenome]